jgi:hypothetical protein
LERCPQKDLLLLLGLVSLVVLQGHKNPSLKRLKKGAEADQRK